MIYRQNLVLSYGPHAISVDGFQSRFVDRGDRKQIEWNAPVISFRKKDGVLRVCAGGMRGRMEVDSFEDARTKTAADALGVHESAHYGARIVARWDGRELWAPGFSESERIETLDVLRPALENYPNVPVGYDGWWCNR